MIESYIPIIRAAMQPIIHHFSLRVSGEEETTSYAEVLFTNTTTGLRVLVDWAEFRPFLTVYRLTPGVTPDSDRPVSHKQRLSFDVDMLLALRAKSLGPVGKMLGSRDTSAVGNLLGEYADALREHASDVLRGDFMIFAELDRRVSERAKELGLQPDP
jgi:hypothetical protein